MLDLAFKYENELQLLFANIYYDDKYKYYFSRSYREKYKASESSWNKHEFVSIQNNKVVGYFSYDIDRDDYSAYALTIINFGNPSVGFAKDLAKFLNDIFQKYQFRKLSFSCIVGNSIEKQYDKLIQRHNGRIVGVKKEQVKLIDGNYYDLKLYEILKSEYDKT